MFTFHYRRKKWSSLQIIRVCPHTTCVAFWDSFKLVILAEITLEDLLWFWTGPLFYEHKKPLNPTLGFKSMNALLWGQSNIMFWLMNEEKTQRE